jgi:hypothetical protein
VSVEGQDERAKEVFDRLRLEWKSDPEATKERAPVMSLALAALVEAEARERELEIALGKKQMAHDFQREAADEAETRVALLVEALNGLVESSRRAAAALPERHPEQTLLLLAADRARSALAEVVEAEPDGSER